MDFMIWKGLTKLERMDVPQISALNPSPVKQNAGDGHSVSVGVAVILLRHIISHLLSPPSRLGKDGILSTCLSEQSQGNTHIQQRTEIT